MAGFGARIDAKVYPNTPVVDNVFREAGTSKQYWVRDDDEMNLPVRTSDVGGIRRMTRGKLDEENNIEKNKRFIAFVKNNFTQMECNKFVPRKNQKVKARKLLRCECGAVISDHNVSGMKRLSEHTLVETIVPKELQEIMSVQNRNLAPPEPAEMPEVKWDKTTNLKSSATKAFGRINYINVENTGGKKPTKYVRLRDKDPIDKLIELMKTYWRIMEPREPHLCISVVGGAKNFKLDGRNRETFRTGLIKAAKTTDAWLITSGFNMGVMKEVGEAVSEGQSFIWQNNRMIHGLRCIGIAPWGFVRYRHSLESEDGRGKFDADYKTSNSIPHGQPVPLNPDHTHFVFVDDGYRNNYRGVAAFRADFQNRISKSTKDNGLGIPVVLVIVEGGDDTITDAWKCLDHEIPVVVCAGTGRAANILAYAYEHVARSGDETMNEKYKTKLGDKIHNTYGQKWEPDKVKDKTKEILDVVLKCCEKRESIVIHNMNKHEELDVAILSALLKVKDDSGNSKDANDAEIEQRKNKIRLAMTWNRADIAQEEIFREDVLWPLGSLDDMLVDAIVKDKVEFVQLICKQGITMREFLTKHRLQIIYNKAMEEESLHTSRLAEMMERLKIKHFHKEPTLDKVTKLMKRLLDIYDDCECQNFVDNTSMDTLDQKDSNHDKFTTYKYPYKQLLIWAVLMNRQTMAKYFWQMGTEPVNSAIAASRIYHRLKKFSDSSHYSSVKETMIENKNEFEQLALNVLNECHIKDRKKAIEIAETKSPAWSGMTSMEMAALAKDRAFLASEACQNSIRSTWSRGIVSSVPRKLVCLMFPFLIYTKILQRETSEYGKRNESKIQQFYRAPSTKFIAELFMYLAFLALFTYMVLVDFTLNHITYMEIVCVAWVVTFIIDDTYTALSTSAPTFHRKRRLWYTPLKVLDLLNFISTIIAFVIHIYNFNQAAKTMYCINCVAFCLRILRAYTANSKLGPNLVMIKNMYNVTGWGIMTLVMQHGLASIVELAIFLMIVFVFLISYGISSQGLLYLQRKPSWTILKDILYYPYWQLYGEIFLNEIDTDDACLLSYNGTVYDDSTSYCRRYHLLVEVFLAAYLIIGNILLLNLLIAIFSNVFKSIDENSHEIWKYQMYVFTMEYDGKAVFLPPFSIFEHAYYCLRWGFTICCKKEEEVQQFSNRHLEYLQLFEKEEMSTYLRKRKEAEKSSEEKIGKLQKRVDEQFNQLEEEFFAEAEDNRIFQNEIKEEMQKLKETIQGTFSMNALGTFRPTDSMLNEEKLQNIPPDINLPTEQKVVEEEKSVTNDIPADASETKEKKKKKKKSKKKENEVIDNKTIDESKQKTIASDIVDAPETETKSKEEYRSLNLNNLSEPKAVTEKFKYLPLSDAESTKSVPKPVTTEQSILMDTVLHQHSAAAAAAVQLQKRMEEARRKRILEEDKNQFQEFGVPVYQHKSDSSPKTSPQRRDRNGRQRHRYTDDSDSSDDNVQHRRRRHLRRRDSFDEGGGRRRKRKQDKAQLVRENTSDYWNID